MAINIDANFSDLNLCDTDNWSGGDLMTIGMIQGTGCMGDAVSATTGTLRTATITSTDMTDGGHVYVWLNCGGTVDTKANGGYRIHLQSSSGNSKLWYVGGNDTHPTGWNCFVLDPQDGNEYSETGTFDASSVTQIGVQFKTLTSTRTIGKEVVQNVFWDAFRYGSGLTITSGTTDGIDFAGIFAEDDNVNNKWGVVQYKEGAYFVTGTLTFGDATGTDSIDFDDTSKVVIFSDSDFIASDFNKIEVVGNGTGTTNFVIGDKVGGQGISGCVFKSVDDGTAFSFTATDTDIDILTIYGSTFFNASSIALPVTASNREVITCTFEACEEVTASTCTIQYCTFVSADVEGLMISSTSHNVSDCTFISCPVCVEIDTIGTYTFDNMGFYGSNGSTLYDLENSSSGLVTIDATNGTNLNSSYVNNTGGGSTTVNNAVNITVNVKDADNVAIENAQVAVYTTSGDTQLMNEDTTSLGVATETYNYSADTDIYYRVRKSSTGTTRYVPVQGVGTITSAGFTATIVMYEDINII